MTTRDILAGAYFLGNKHYETTWTRFLSNLEKASTSSSSNTRDIMEEYANCTSSEQRIAFFETFFEWEEPLLGVGGALERLNKSSSVSTALRTTGNEFYSKKNDFQLSQALRSYNLAICFAPLQSLELALGFANRSALFLQMGEEKMSLKDIELALELKSLLDPSIVLKLEARRIKCMELLANKGLELFSKTDQGELFVKERFGNLSNPSDRLLGAESTVGIVYDEDKGRRLIATEDIPAGSLILIDKPYTILLEKLLNWDTEHCASCLRPLLGGIPDDETSFGLYCDENCLHDKTPHFTPQLLNYIHASSNLHDLLLPLAVIFKSPDFELYNSSSIKVKGFLSTNNNAYNPNTFNAAFNLISHETRYVFNEDSHCLEFDCILLSNLVQGYSSFKPPSNINLASLLLHFSQNLPYNALSLCEWRSEGLGPISQPLWGSLARKRIVNPTTNCYGNGIFCLVALCNNSCDPNAIFLKQVRANDAILISSKNIKSGDEITISYKSVWNRMEFEERKDYLLSNYHFNCTCYACNGSLGPSSVLKEPVGVGTNDKRLSMLLTSVSSDIQSSVQLIQEDKFTEAYDLIIKCLRGMIGKLCPPEFEMNVVLGELLRRVLVQLGHL